MSTQHSDALESAKVGTPEEAPNEAPVAEKPVLTAPDYDLMTVAEIRKWGLLQDPPLVVPKKVTRRAKVIAEVQKHLEHRAAMAGPAEFGFPAVASGRGPDPRKILGVVAPTPEDVRDSAPVPFETWMVLRPARLKVGRGGAVRIRPGKLLRRATYTPTEWAMIVFALRDGGMKKVDA